MKLRVARKLGTWPYQDRECGYKIGSMQKAQARIYKSCRRLKTVREINKEAGLGNACGYYSPEEQLRLKFHCTECGGDATSGHAYSCVLWKKRA